MTTPRRDECRRNASPLAGRGSGRARPPPDGSRRGLTCPGRRAQRIADILGTPRRRDPAPADGCRARLHPASHRARIRGIPGTATLQLLQPDGHGSRRLVRDDARHRYGMRRAFHAAGWQGLTTMELKLNLVRALTDAVPLVRAEGRLVGPDGKLYAHASTTCLVFDRASEKIRTKGFDPARASIIAAHQGSRLGAPRNADVATTKIDVVPRSLRRCGLKPIWPLVQLRPCDDGYLT